MNVDLEDESRDRILVFVRFGPGASGIGAVIVRRDTPGMTLSSRHEFMSGSSWYEVFFGDAVLPSSDVLFDGDDLTQPLVAGQLLRSRALQAVGGCPGLGLVGVERDERRHVGALIADRHHRTREVGGGANGVLDAVGR